MNHTNFSSTYQKEDLRSLNKHIALQNVYLYKTLNYRSTKAINSKQ